MQNTGLSEAAQLMTDLWQLIKAYYIPPSDPDAPYWHDLMSDAEKLIEKHGRSRLAKELTQGFISYIADEYKEKHT